MMNKSRQGAAPLLWVFAVLAILFLLTERVMHSLEVEETIAESNRLERLADTGFQNVIQWAKWSLERDVRLSKEDKTSPYDSLEDVWTVGPETPYWDESLPELLIRWRLIDGQSLFNINSLVSENGLISEVDRERLTNLMTELQLPQIEELVYSLCDWLDGEPLEDSSQETPGDPNAFEVGARNAPLTLLSELEMVPGFTEEILWGEEDQEIPSFAQCVTLHSDGKLNPNTAPAWIVRASDPLISPSIARSIVDGRASQPYKKLDKVKEVAGVSEVNFEERFTVTSTHFILEMEADYNGRTRRQRAFLERDYEKGLVTITGIERRGFFKWTEDVQKTMKNSEDDLLEEIKTQ